MTNFIFAIILILIAIGAIDVLKSYREYSKKELKSRARSGDHLAEKLYQAAAYESSLDILLYLVVALSFSGGFLLLNSLVPAWLSFIFLVILILLTLVWMPKIKVTRLSKFVAHAASGPLAYVLNYVHPILSKIVEFTRTNITHPEGIYDEADLSRKLNELLASEDNSINKAELKFLINTLEATALGIDKFFTPWKKLKTMYLDDVIGPIVLNDLHKAKQKIVPVLSDKKEKKLVGLINIEKLDVNKTSNIKSNLDKTILYIEDEASVIDALLSFGETNSAAFIVIDDQQNHVGLLTLGDVVNKLTEGLSVTKKSDELDLEIDSSEPANEKIIDTKE